ncbi:MAG: hypothetical protein VB143_05775 [Burkholderia sp.]
MRGSELYRLGLSGHGFATQAASLSVPARIVWTRFCNSGGLFEGGCLTGFMG